MGNTVLGLRISNSPGSEEKVKPCQHSIYNFFSNSINTFLLKKKKSRFHCWKTTYSIIICKTGNHDSEALIFCYILSFCFLVTFLFYKGRFLFRWLKFYDDPLILLCGLPSVLYLDTSQFKMSIAKEEWRLPNSRDWIELHLLEGMSCPCRRHTKSKIQEHRQIHYFRHLNKFF